jgi:hypothetical protein
MPRLFSYGTLQQDTVQMSTFGRLLQGQADELAVADQYEPAPYTRITALLASGRRAWVYADARSP